MWEGVLYIYVLCVFMHVYFRNLEVNLRFHFSRPIHLKILRQALSLEPVAHQLG